MYIKSYASRFFLLSLLSLLLLSCQAKAQSTSASTPIRAVTENAYPPLNFVNAKGENAGLEYELTNKIASIIGRPVEWHLSNWDVMIQSIRQEMYDVAMDGITVTPERKNEVDFSIPYMKISQIMLVRSQESRFANAAQFSSNTSLRLGVQPGTTGFYVAVDMMDSSSENPGGRIVSFENFGACVQALISGDVDMVITDQSAAKRWIKSTQGGVKTLDDVLSSEELAFIFPKGSPLVAEFNTAIQKLQADGSLDQMINYWFSEYEES